MKTIRAISVADGLQKGIALLDEYGRKVSPRGIETLEYPEPVATVYEDPARCVLRDAIRDANPFFHVMEALWILAGRRDVAFPVRYNSRMGEFSDAKVANGEEIFHGAYGYRLREFYMTDQLEVCARILEADPDSRKAVAAIWHVGQDLGSDTKDLPCNDMIFFKIRGGDLNMTVCCRSNDIIWGCYGTNAVQFSFIMQWMAARLGVYVGKYTQISDSYHAYTDINHPGSVKWNELVGVTVDEVDPDWTYCPVVDDPKVFDSEVKAFVNEEEGFTKSWGKAGNFMPVYSEPFLADVAVPMKVLWESRKEPKFLEVADERLSGYLNDLKDNEWVAAGIEWIQRRRCPDED